MQTTSSVGNITPNSNLQEASQLIHFEMQLISALAPTHGPLVSHELHQLKHLHFLFRVLWLVNLKYILAWTVIVVSSHRKCYSKTNLGRWQIPGEFLWRMCGQIIGC